MLHVLQHQIQDDLVGAKSLTPTNIQVKGVWALPFEAAIAGLVGMLFLMVFFTAHSVWVSSEMYSAPSIVLQSRSPDGSVHVFDDFRESYAWLNANTHDNAKVRLLMQPRQPWTSWACQV